MLEGGVPNPGSSQGLDAPGRGGARQPPHCSMLERGCFLVMAACAPHEGGGTRALSCPSPSSTASSTAM